MDVSLDLRGASRSTPRVRTARRGAGRRKTLIPLVCNRFVRTWCKRIGGTQGGNHPEVGEEPKTPTSVRLATLRQESDPQVRETREGRRGTAVEVGDYEVQISCAPPPFVSTRTFLMRPYFGVPDSATRQSHNAEHPQSRRRA